MTSTYHPGQRVSVRDAKGEYDGGWYPGLIIRRDRDGYWFRWEDEDDRRPRWAQNHDIKSL
jgi:hypothetical protein